MGGLEDAKEWFCIIILDQGRAGQDGRCDYESLFREFSKFSSPAEGKCWPHWDTGRLWVSPRYDFYISYALRRQDSPYVHNDISSVHGSYVPDFRFDSAI